ncbi:cholinesterase-like isoform X2 [Dermacentor albipictus]|uniref:cholinesterase-like isoform X2 n=1 Tax=Dermacentor albipictus TaxID=60249 RepID=UPI0031FDEBD1
MWRSLIYRKKRSSSATLSSNVPKSGAVSPSDRSAGPVSPSGSIYQTRRDVALSRRPSQQSARQALFSEGAHTFWSMRTGMQASRTYLQDVRTRDLMCLVASIVSVALVLVSVHAVIQRISPEIKSVVVDGHFGSVHGSVTVVAGVLISSFLGVPYADQRTLRFAAPVPWHRKLYQFDATSPAPACAQSNIKQDEMNISTSEDCLHLNIWTPSCDGRICPGNLTIVFFIHGGFFQAGSNNDPYHDGRILAAVGEVMVVVPNWRLGRLGFVSMATADSPLNVGFLDQAEAFQWVRRNAEPFGGNASDVVIVAHASGASALGYHMFAGEGMVPGARKLVFMSESPFTRYPVYGLNRAPDQMRAILARLLCGDEASNKGAWLQCWRRLPVESLFKTPPGALRGLPTFFPNLPIMWNPVMWKKLRGAGQRKWTQELLSDIAVVCPVRLFAEQLHSLGNRVHTYVFHRSDPTSDEGVGRDDVVRFLFGSAIARDLTIEERVFSRRVMARMVQFFKTGEIHGENDTVADGKYSVTFTSSSNELPRWVPDFRKEACENLRKYFPVIVELPDSGQR